jgi:hypothetical protein
MMKIAADIVIIIVGSFVLVMYAVEEFLRLMKKTGSRWPLAIIGLLSEIALLGGITYGLLRFF